MSIVKNNSEFIYYGKYNKELPRPRSFSKQRPGDRDCSLSSDESKSVKNALKVAAKKSSVAKSGIMGSASVQKGKKPPVPKASQKDIDLDPAEAKILRKEDIKDESDYQNENREMKVNSFNQVIDHKPTVESCEK